MTCKETAILLSQDVDGELAPHNRAALRAHLAICGACVQVQRQIRLLKDALGKRSKFDSPSSASGFTDDSKARIEQALKEAMNDSDSAE